MSKTERKKVVLQVLGHASNVFRLKIRYNLGISGFGMGMALFIGRVRHELLKGATDSPDYFHCSKRVKPLALFCL